MELSYELISAFAKTVNGDKKQSTESTVYGTVEVDSLGNKYVRLDGSDQLTPLTEENRPSLDTTTANSDAGDRVTVLIKNHTATVIGNVSAPATNSKEVDGKIAEASIIIAEQIQAERAYFETMIADKATVGELEAATAKITELEAGKASVDELTAVKADVDNLEATKIDADVVMATYATITSLEATDAKVGSLDATIADINTLMFGSATGNVLHTEFANAVIALLGDAQIKSAMIESIDASKINAGSIDTNKVKIESTDGNMVISDNTMQISDGTRVRVQIGKDASDDYSINIWDADGNLMFSEGGITDKAIKDAIIRNDMVADDANIDAKKLDISSLFAEINGSTETIKSTKIYIDSQEQTLDVAFGEMSTTVAEQGETISSQGTDISVMQGQIESKIWQQDIDTAAEAQNTKYTELKQDLDGFKVTARETYSTRNMVLEMQKLSDDFDKDSKTWSGYGTWEYIENHKHNQCAVRATAKNSGICMYLNPFVDEFDIGDDMTLSVTIDNTTDTDALVHFGNMQLDSGGNQVYLSNYDPINLGVVPAGESRRVSATLPLEEEIVELIANGGTSMLTIHVAGDGNYASALYFYAPKFEKGSEATPWTPAYEDAASSGDLKATTDAINRTITENVATLTANADGIAASVVALEKTTDDMMSGVNNRVDELRREVDLKMTPEAVTIEIEKAIQNGTTKVVTTTGFTFDENGMLVDKTDSPTNTQITENGMTVTNKESNKAMLKANKDGVDAVNLEAKTYLIIAGRSRLENIHGTNRIGCFWIGE